MEKGGVLVEIRSVDEGLFEKERVAKLDSEGLLGASNDVDATSLNYPSNSRTTSAAL